MDSSEQPTRVPPQKSRGGRWVTFGDEQYRVPPLGFRQIQDLEGKVQALATMRGMPNDDQMRTIAEIVHAALSRNYPDLSIDDVLDMLDLGNFRETLDAVMAISGFQRTEGHSQGEAVTASTGTGSTPS